MSSLRKATVYCNLREQKRHFELVILDKKQLAKQVRE